MAITYSSRQLIHPNLPCVSPCQCFVRYFNNTTHMLFWDVSIWAISHSRLTWINFSVGQRHGIWILMYQSVPSYRLLLRGTYQPMITSWGAKKNPLNWQPGLPGGYHQHKIILATTYQQSAEQSQQDTWLTQKNTACGVTARETNSIRDTRATNARVCHMRLGTSHKDRHSDNRARIKIRCAVYHW